MYFAGSLLTFFVACGHLVQQSMQGNHCIMKPPSELEVAMTIGHLFQMQPAGQKDLGKAVAQAASSMPPCKSYIKVLVTLWLPVLVENPLCPSCIAMRCGAFTGSEAHKGSCCSCMLQVESTWPSQ